MVENNLFKEVTGIDNISDNMFLSEGEIEYPISQVLSFLEMAGLESKYTKLPRKIYVVTAEENEKLIRNEGGHKDPHIHVDTKNQGYVPISIEKSPKILVKKGTWNNMRKEDKNVVHSTIEYVSNNYNPLLQYWHGEILLKELLDTLA